MTYSPWIRFAVLVVLMLSASVRAQTAPAGDGKADDTQALQYQLDHSYRVRLVSGRVYRITNNLNIAKPTILESTVPGKPATILYDQGPRPYGKCHVSISAKLGPETWWEERIGAGVRPTTRPAAGRYVAGYGADPFDPNEERFVGFSDAGGLPMSPADVEGKHWYAPILSSPDGSTIRDIKFDQTAGTIIDYSVGVFYARSITIQNISGNFYIAVQLGSCESVNIDGLKGKAIWHPPHTASNRAISAGQARGITVNNVDMSISDQRATIMFENWCKGVIMQNIRLRLRDERDPNGGWPPIGPVYFAAGHSEAIAVLNTRIDTEKTQGLYLYDNGGTPEQEPIRFDLVLHTGVPVELGPASIRRLVKVPVE